MKNFLSRWNDSNVKNFPRLYAENTSNDLKTVELIDEKFLIPSNCALHCKNVEEMPWSNLAPQYDLIVIDPPWWNKYIRRTMRHNTDNGYGSEIFDICSLYFSSAKH